MNIRFLETPAQMAAVERLQQVIWQGSELDVVPTHLLLTAAHNGGLMLGAFAGSADDAPLIGFVFGFLGLIPAADGTQIKHCSHMLGVHPDFRGQGIGFRLKRAQWQWVRRQGVELITWTYDPLLSRNAHLNIARLGAICRNYHREVYGQMRDALNAGLPSDRFEVEWWLRSPRVEQRLRLDSRKGISFEQCLQSGAILLNPVDQQSHWVHPTWQWQIPNREENKLVLVEVPADFPALKKADRDLALDWRLHTREMFGLLFREGYLVTDFVYQSQPRPRSFYLLAHGDSQLDGS